MRLLIIEDHPALRESVAQYLREVGFIVEDVATGDEGLWAASENPYDAILLDLMLPEVNGMEILRRLRAKENPPHFANFTMDSKDIQVHLRSLMILRQTRSRSGSSV